MTQEVIDTVLADSIKVTGAASCATIAIDFIDGWGRVIVWALSFLYISLKCYQIVRAEWITKLK